MKDYALNENDWENLSKINNLQSNFADISQFCETIKYPTIYLSISFFNNLFDVLDDAVDIPEFTKGATQAWNKLKKYYTLSDSSPVNILSTFLSPSFKIQYFQEKKFKTTEIENIMHK